MAIFFMLVASGFISFANFFMRKSIDRGGTTKGFLVVQMTTAFIIAVFLNPIRTGNYAFNGPIALFGLFSGLVLATMLFSLGRSLESGPPGVTFSILNASTVMPGILMALLFGAALGFPYTSWHALGSLLVLTGLFWAGKTPDGFQNKQKWILFSSAMFFLHVLLLVLFQWRALLLNLSNPQELASFFTAEQIRSQWFMPCMFLSSAFVQIALFLRYEKRPLYPQEILYGLIGGITNAFCTYFMIWSTEVASPLENAIIFPVFSVMTILLSNFWGQKVYQEKVNWRACQLCAFGLIIGTVNWKTLAALIGF